MERMAAWGLLAAFALILIVAGIRGRLGSVAGALITPAQLQDSPNALGIG